MKQQRIRTLTRIEDPNDHLVFTPEGNVQIDDASGKARTEFRIDRWPKGAVVDVPDYQARNLIRIGAAEAADEAELTH